MQQNSFSKNGNFGCFGYCSIILKYCINQTHLKQDLIQFRKKYDWWISSSTKTATLPLQHQQSHRYLGEERGRKHKVETRTEFSAVAYKLLWKEIAALARAVCGRHLQHPPNNAVISREFQSKFQSSMWKLRSHRGWEKFELSCATPCRCNSPGFRHLSKSSSFRSHKPFWLSTHLQRWEEVFQDSRNQVFLISYFFPCYVVDN